MIQQIDVSILMWIQEHLRFEILTPLWKAVTFLGNGGWFWIVLGVGFLAVRKTRRVGLRILLALLIGALITNVALKNLVARIRPYEYTEVLQALLPPQSDFSFPSGHTCASFAAAWVCWREFPVLFGGKGAGIAALVLAGMIAFSRLYLGVHYPTDILGGLLIGLFAGGLSLRILRSGMHPAQIKNRILK